METVIEPLGYEVAFSQLEQILLRLEKDDLPLAEALALYEQGSKLTAHCSKQLEDAALRVRQWQGNGETKTFEGWQAEA